jgi:hypothetical protein
MRFRARTAMATSVDRAPHTVNPCTITADKNAAHPRAFKAMKKVGEL